MKPESDPFIQFEIDRAKKLAAIYEETAKLLLLNIISKLLFKLSELRIEDQ